MKKFMAGLVIGISLSSIGAYAAGIIQSAQYNETKVIVDGQTLTLDQPLISVQEEGVEGIRNYMPIRAVLEQLGYTVDWDGENNAVVIQSAPGATMPEVINEAVDGKIGTNADMAGQLVQAELDAQLKQQHNLLAELTGESVDSIKATYDNELETVMDELSKVLTRAGMNITDEQVERLKNGYVKIFSYADYTIENSQEDGDDFIVTVKYTTVINYMNIEDLINEKVDALDESEIDNMSLEDRIALSMELYVEAYEEVSQSAAYGEEGTATIRVSAEDGSYVCDLDDLQELVSKMFPEL